MISFKITLAKIVGLFFLVSLVHCQTPKVKVSQVIDLNLIKKDSLKSMLYTYASNDFKGREAGTENEKIATEYIRDFYIKNKIPQAPNTQNYYQTIPQGTFQSLKGNANNVIAMIEGSDKKEEFIVVCAHLDHLGEKENKIYNGADDNGSGTIAILNIAKAIQRQVNQGNQPRRSILFIHFTGEEKGLLGSKYLSKNQIIPFENIVTALNIDMIGRVDKEHTDSPNYLYLIGSDKLSKELKAISESVNEKTENLDLDYRYDSPDDPNRFYYRSDHYFFAKENIPIIFYFNGTHEDYHEESDTPDKIDYTQLNKRTQLILATLWELANREDKPKLDK